MKKIKIIHEIHITVEYVNRDYNVYHHKDHTDIPEPQSEPTTVARNDSNKSLIPRTKFDTPLDM
jgi:hypothetical protein